MQKKLKIIMLVLCFLLVTIPVLELNGHTYRLPLIVDTDMALDDVRALIMLFNLDIADTLLVVTSDGVVSPKRGACNLKILLALLGKQDIKIAVGRELHKENPSWREWSENIFSFAGSGSAVIDKKTIPAAEAIVDILHTTDSPCAYLCLGPLTNLGDALKIDSSIKDNISRIIYYGTSPAILEADWNTGRDLPGSLPV